MYYNYKVKCKKSGEHGGSIAKMRLECHKVWMVKARRLTFALSHKSYTDVARLELQKMKCTV